MIKNILSKFFKLNTDRETNKTEEKLELKNNQHNLEILITLTKDYEIDLLVYLKDKPQQPLTEMEYAMVCCEFLNNCFSNSIKNEIISIINRDIKTESNSRLINAISILSSTQNLLSDDDLYIKPSQVFNNHPS